MSKWLYAGKDVWIYTYGLIDKWLNRWIDDYWMDQQIDKKIYLYGKIDG